MLTDIVDIVGSKLAAEEAAAKEAAARFHDAVQAPSIVNAPDEFTQFFFPDLKRDFGKSGWSCWPQYIQPGYSRIHHVLVARPHFVDLEPTLEEDFSTTYRGKFQNILELAREGHLIGDIYVRDLKTWERAARGGRLNYLKPLLELKTTRVKGRLVDAYLQAIFPRYDHAVANFEAEIRKALHRFRDRAPQKFDELVLLPCDRRPSAIDEIARRDARRRLYLEVFNLSAEADRYDELLDCGDIATAFEIARVGKIAASPISAALGGDFCWDKRTLDEFKDWSDAARIKSAAEVRSDTGGLSLAEYSLRLSANPATVLLPGNIDVEDILVHKITRNSSKLLQFRSDLTELMDKLYAEEFEKGNVSNHTLAEWNEAVRGMQDSVGRIGAVSDAVNSIVKLLTVGFSEWLNVGEIISVKKAHEYLFPRRHRVVELVATLRGM